MSLQVSLQHVPHLASLQISLCHIHVCPVSLQVSLCHSHISCSSNTMSRSVLHVPSSNTMSQVTLCHVLRPFKYYYVMSLQVMLFKYHYNMSHVPCLFKYHYVNVTVTSHVPSSNTTSHPMSIQVILCHVLHPSSTTCMSRPFK
jgi:hypothetical protein